MTPQQFRRQYNADDVFPIISPTPGHPTGNNYSLLQSGATVRLRMQMRPAEIRDLAVVLNIKIKERPDIELLSGRFLCIGGFYGERK